ncbi:MAG: gfo/Idh/MocA family oxidoreductase, partial [Firmicutes bacterium]|nr:gfo/Idh/MocA family oxidoreductase [Bacillota bacterium]
DVTEVQVSISHGYHAISLLRRFLGVAFSPVVIRGMRFASPLIAGPTRSGVPKEERVNRVARDMVWLDWGERLGIYDFTKDQHRSWIRATHMGIRGVRGEIFDRSVQTLQDYHTPVYLQLTRIHRGEEENVEGSFLSGIVCGERVVYHNPYQPASLTDDEIAVATCLTRMANYARGGPGFYDLREAAHDHYLAMLMQQAIDSGEEVHSEPQSWTGE